MSPHLTAVVPGRYDPYMSETVQPKRTKLGNAHWTVLAIWAVLTGWLLISMISSVVDSLFFGDGPLKTEQAQVAPDAATPAPQAPTP